jgi:hypothetical protein
VLERLDLDTETPTDEELARKFGYEEDYLKGRVSWWQHLKPQMWSLFDEPYSSNAAKVSINRVNIQPYKNTISRKHVFSILRRIYNKVPQDDFSYILMGKGNQRLLIRIHSLTLCTRGIHKLIS